VPINIHLNYEFIYIYLFHFVAKLDLIKIDLKHTPSFH